jgi:hypothetical protein
VLALVFSLLLTLYVVVPEAVFRLTFGIKIPPRSFVLTKTETAYRAVLVAFFRFWIALASCWYAPIVKNWPFPVQLRSIPQRRADYKLVVSALYSEAEYVKSQQLFWPTLTRCMRRQTRLCLWYLLLVAVEGWFVGSAASKFPKYASGTILRWFSDRVLSPYISHWYPLLTTSNVVPTIEADVLCTNDILYQGVVSEHFLKEGGELSGIILSEPRRFNRDAYKSERDKGSNPKKIDFWVPIPSQNLYFFFDKIVNMNLRYVAAKASPQAVQKFLTEEVSFGGELGKLSVVIEEAADKKSSPPADK